MERSKQQEKNTSKQQENIPYNDYQQSYYNLQSNATNCSSNPRYNNQYQYSNNIRQTQQYADQEWAGTIQALAQLNSQSFQPYQPYLSQPLAHQQNSGNLNVKVKSVATPTWTNSNRGQQTKKRQRYDETSVSPRKQIPAPFGRNGGRSVLIDVPSECCSSCESGTLCTEPDCDAQIDLVVTCTSPACEQPVCTEPCLKDGIPGGSCSLSQGSLPSIEKFASWDNTTWTPQESAAIDILNSSAYRLSHNAGVGNRQALQETAPSPVPTTPSLVMNMDSPYADPTAMQRSQSSGYSVQQQTGSTSGTSLSGAGMRFDDNMQMFNCNWLDCGQPMQDQFEWHKHFHQEHIDPQFTFNCPIPSGTCQSPLDTNPLHHLQMTHGFTFDTNSNGFTCPAPDCLADEMYCDPSMLHNHLDQMHAIPLQGELQCQVDACNTMYQDSQQFFNHLNLEHNLPIPMSPIEEIDLSSVAMPGSKEKPKEKPRQQDGDNHLSCKWTTDEDHTCGEVFHSEEELQTHVKRVHLSSLNKQSGYFCKWQGCSRKAKMGDKEGFSQRGKLERHMASHTGYKDCVCDTCGKTFSAVQSLKQHIRLHTGEKPWKCRYCPKSFPQQSACTVHERIHTQEKPLVCNICGKTFSESSNLAKHRKTHGEKGNYECTECPKTFHRLDQLKRHQETHERKAKKAGAAAGKEESLMGSEEGVGTSEEGRDD